MPTPTTPVYAPDLSPALQAIVDATKARQAAEAAKAVAPTVKADGAIPAPAATKPKPTESNDPKPTSAPPNQRARIAKDQADTLARTGQAAPQTKKIIAEAKALKSSQPVVPVPVAPIAPKPITPISPVSAQSVLPIAPPSAIKSPELLTPIVGKDTPIPGTDGLTWRMEGLVDTITPEEAQKNIDREAESREFYKLLGENQKNLPKLTIPEGKKVEKVDLDTLDIPTIADEYMRLQHNPAAVNDQVNPLPTFGMFAAKKWAEKGVSTEQAATVLTQNKVRWDDVASRAKTELNGLSAYDPEEDKRRFNTWMKRDEIPLTEEMKATKTAADAARKTRVEDLAAATYQPGVTEQTFGIGPVGVVEGADIGVTTTGYSASTLGTHSAAAQHEADKLFAYLTIRSGGEDPRNELEPYLSSGNWQAGVEAVAKKLMSASAREGHAMDAEEALRRGFQLIAAMQTKGMWNHIIAFKDVNDPFLKSLGERIGPNRVIVGISGRPGENGKLVARQETAAAWLMNSALQVPESIVQGGKKAIAAADIASRQAAPFIAEEIADREVPWWAPVDAMGGSMVPVPPDVTRNQAKRVGVATEVFMKRIEPEVARAIEERANAVVTNLEIAQQYGVTDPAALGFFGALGFAESIFTPSPVEIASKAKNLTTGYDVIRNGQKIRYNGLVDVLKNTQSYQNTAPYVNHIMEAVNRSAVGRALDADLARGLKNVLHYAPTSVDQNIDGHNARKLRDVALIGDDAQMKAQQAGLNTHTANAQTGSVVTSLPTDINDGMKAFEEAQAAVGNALPEMRTHLNRLHGELEQIVERTRGGSLDPLSRQAADALNDAEMGEALRRVAVQAESKVKDGQFVGDIEKANMGASFRRSPRGIEADNFEKIYGSRAQLNKVAELKNTSVNGAPLITPVSRQDAVTAVQTIMTRNGAVATDPALLALTNKLAEDILDGKLSYNQAKLRIQAFRNQEIKSIQTALKGNPTQIKLATAQKRLEISDATGKLYRAHKEARVQNYLLKPQELLATTERALWLKHEIRSTAMKVLASHIDNLRIEGGLGDRRSTAALASIQQAAEKGITTGHATEGTPGVWGAMKEAVAARRMKAPPLSPQGLQFRNAIVKAFEGTTHPMSPLQARWSASVTEARARAWATTNGRPMTAYYAEHFGEELNSANMGVSGGTNIPGAKGSTTQLMSAAGQNRRIIEFFKNADFATAMHELAHVFRNDLGSTEMELFALEQRSRGIPVQLDESGREFVSMDADVFAQMQAIQAKLDDATAAEWNIWVHDIEAVEEDIKTFQRAMRDLRADIKQTKATEGGADVDLLETQTAKAQTIRAALKEKWAERAALRAQEYSPELVASRVVDLRERMAAEEGMALDLRIQYRLEEDRLIREAAEQAKNDAAEMNSLTPETAGRESAVPDSLERATADLEAIKKKQAELGINYKGEIPVAKMMALHEEEGRIADRIAKLKEAEAEAVVAGGKVDTDALAEKVRLAEQRKNELIARADANKDFSKTTLGRVQLADNELRKLQAELEAARAETKAANTADDFGDDERAFAQMEDDIATEAARRAKFVPGKKTPEIIAPSPAATDAPAISPVIAPKVKRAPRGSKQTALDHEAIYRIIFKPGNEVDSYGGGKDIVQSFDYKPDGTWSVTVKGEDGRLRTHNTEPSKATVARYKPEIDAAKEALSGETAKAVSTSAVKKVKEERKSNPTERTAAIESANSNIAAIDAEIEAKAQALFTARREASLLDSAVETKYASPQLSELFKKAVADGVNSEHELGPILSDIATDTNVAPHDRAAAALIASLVEQDTRLKLRITTDEYPADTYRNDITAWYDGDSHSVVFTVAGASNRGNATLIHEAAHAITSQMLYAGENLVEHARSGGVLQEKGKRLVAAYEEITKLWMHARHNLGPDTIDGMNYGMKNQHEFIAEIFSNASFRDNLKLIAAPDGAKETSLFASLTKALARLWDAWFPTESPNVLGEAYKAIDYLLRQTPDVDIAKAEGRIDNLLSSNSPSNKIADLRDELSALKQKRAKAEEVLAAAYNMSAKKNKSAPKDYVPPTDKQITTAVNATLKQLDGYKDLAENGSKEDIADIKALLNAYIRAKLGQSPNDAMEAAQDFFNKYPTDFAGMNREQFIRQVELDLKAGYGLEAPSNVLGSAVAKDGSRKTLYQTDSTATLQELQEELARERAGFAMFRRMLDDARYVSPRKAKYVTPEVTAQLGKLKAGAKTSKLEAHTLVSSIVDDANANETDRATASVLLALLEQKTEVNSKKLIITKDSSRLGELSALAFYSPVDHAINFGSTVVTNGIVLHEVAHAVTSKLLNTVEDIVAPQKSYAPFMQAKHAAAVDAYKELNRVFLEAKAEISARHEYYGLDDIHEFVAEVFGNAEFRAALEAITLSPGAVKKDATTSVLSSIISAITRLWAVFLPKENALNAAYSAIDNLLRATPGLDVHLATSQAMRISENIPTTDELNELRQTLYIKQESIAALEQRIATITESKGKTLYQTDDRNAPYFYSGLERTIEERIPGSFTSIPGKKSAATQAIEAIKKSPLYRAEEDKWTGLSDWLRSKEGQEKIDSSEILGFVMEQTPKVEIKRFEGVTGKSFIDKFSEFDYSTILRDGWRAQLQTANAPDYVLSAADKFKAAVDKWDNLPSGPNDNWVVAQQKQREINAPMEHAFKASLNQWKDEVAGVVGGGAHWPTYHLPDGTDQFEILISPNQTNKFNNPHFRGETGTVHIRGQKRVVKDANGKDKTILELTEIQNDWAQSKKAQEDYFAAIKAKDVVEQEVLGPNGFRSLKYGSPEYAAMQSRKEAAYTAINRAKKKFDAQSGRQDINITLPEYPHKASSSWVELGLKTAIRKAAEDGIDEIRLISGDVVQKIVGGEEGGQLEFYNEIIPNVMDGLGNRIGARVESAPSIEYINGLKKELENIETAVAGSVKRGETPDVEKVKEAANLKPRIAKLEKRRAALGESQTTLTGKLDKERANFIPTGEQLLRLGNRSYATLDDKLNAIAVVEQELKQYKLFTPEVTTEFRRWAEDSVQSDDTFLGDRGVLIELIDDAVEANRTAPVVRTNPLVIKLSPELMESVKKEGLPLFQDNISQNTINPSNFTPAVKAEEAFAQQFEQHLLNPDASSLNPVLSGADTWMREVYPTAAVTKPASKEMQEVMDGLFEAKRGFNKPIGKDITNGTKSIPLTSTELGLRLPRTSNDQSPVETVPAQRIYQKMQEENGDGGKLVTEFITKIGDDENASWRSLPPASRKHALAGVRVVQEVTGNASRLVVEAVERRGVGFAHEDEALLAYLDGTSVVKMDNAGNVVSTSLVRYANGSVVPTAGYAPAAEIKAQIAMVWDELPLEDQEFILRIAKQTVLSDADQKGMRALYNRGTTAVNPTLRARLGTTTTSTKNQVRKYGLLKPPIMQSAMKGIHDQDFKEVSELTPDALIWLARIYAHQVNPPANSISATSTLLNDLGAPIGSIANKKTNPGEAKGRAAVLIAAHGGAKFAAKTWTERKLGLARNEVEALQDWLHGRDITLTRDEIKAARVQAKLNNLPKDSLLPQALLDKQKRIPLLAQTFGLDTTNMAKMDELGLTSFGTTYWPAMARKKLGDVITQAESPLTPAMQAALAAGKTMDEARNEKGPMTALRFMVSRLQAVRTSGLFANRPQYFAANLWGDTSQGFVAATNTFRISAANFIRTLPQLMVTNTPVGSAAGAVLQAGEQAARAGAEAISDVAADMKAGGTRDKAQGIARADAVIPAKYEEFRRILQNAGDRAATAISGARFDIRVNKILDRSTEMVPGTDFTYAQFADKMIETGVFASFDASEMERALYTIMTEDSKGAGRMGQAFLIADRDMRRVNRDLAENLTLRSRLGTAITLVSKYAEDAAAAGRPPLTLSDAGKVGDLTTNVLYDYANTMSGWDKHILTKMFFPYQAWRKNNARFFLENLQDPQMVTRMSRLYKFEQNGGRLLTEAMYYIHADPYGVNREELNDDQLALYDQFIYYLEFGRGPVESWNYSQKQDVLYAINKERAPEEKYNNFADAWAGLDEQEKRILVAGYGGPENVPYDVRMGVRQMFGGRGVVTEENSAYQFTPVTDDRGVDILTAAESHEGVGQIDKAVPEKPNRNDLSAYADTRAVVGFTPRRVMVGDVPWIIAPECFVVDPMTNYAAMYEGAHLGMWSVNGFLNDTGMPTKQNWLEVAKHVMEPGRSTGLGPILQYIEDDSQSTEIPVGVGQWMVGNNFAPEWLIKHTPGEVDTNGKVTKSERYYLQPGMSMLFDNVFVTAPVFGLAPEMNREMKRISTRERTPAEFNADKYSMLGIVPEAVRQTGIANITNTSEEKAVRASDLEVETTTNDPAKIRP